MATVGAILDSDSYWSLVLSPPVDAMMIRSGFSAVTASMLSSLFV